MMKYVYKNWRDGCLWERETLKAIKSKQSKSNVEIYQSAWGTLQLDLCCPYYLAVIPMMQRKSFRYTSDKRLLLAVRVLYGSLLSHSVHWKVYSITRKKWKDGKQQHSSTFTPTNTSYRYHRHVNYDTPIIIIIVVVHETHCLSSGRYDIHHCNNQGCSCQWW